MKKNIEDKREKVSYKMFIETQSSKSMLWEITKFLVFLSRKLFHCKCWEDMLRLRVVYRLYS